MATTDIHAITQTVAASVNYVMSDKREAVLKDDIADSIKYVMNDKTGEVTYHTLSSTLNCSNLRNPVEDFYALMNTFGKREIELGNARTKDGAPVLAWHLIQSFDGQVDPRVANEIGRKLAEELFGNHPVVISTHTNTENTHNHIEFCAWDLDGKKYNYDHAAYQKIRTTSDRLCDEYGLSVLEKTRDRKMVQWTDKEGNVHYYEPTDRKNEMIRKRQAGELSSDDVNSYRNSVPYDVATAKKQTNVEIVKQAIDEQLPYATSYEHLLFMLRELGFAVKDKKKNGEWLSHVTFTPPTADKGVRDSSIDKETGYYTRENLTAIIESQNEDRKRSEALQSKLHIPHYDEYVYGEIDVQAINEDYRADVAEDGTYRIVQRGEAERYVIRDVKRSDQELHEYFDTTRLRQLIAEQREAKKKKIPAKTNTELVIRQIQESFENLKFMERKQLYSYEQIIGIVKNIWGQYNACLSKIAEAEAMVERLENIAKVPHTLNEIKQRMEQKKNDPEYITEQYAADAKKLRTCVEIIKKHNLGDPENLQALQTKAQSYREQIEKLQSALASFSAELGEYNRCVSTLARIDRNSGRDERGRELETTYQSVVKAAQEEAQKTNETRKRREHTR